MDAHWKIERYAVYVRSPALGSGGNAVPHIILLLGLETAGVGDEDYASPHDG
jgi:hypothetical protein